MPIKKIQHTFINPALLSKAHDQNDLYSTSDLGCAAAIISTGFPLFSHTIREQKAEFNFVRHEGLEEITRAYFANELWTKARTYRETMKMLKSLIHTT